MLAAQTGLNTVSTNVANINTAGYVQKVVGLNTQDIQGVGVGVQPTSVQLAANQFLQNASLSASASAGKANVVSSMISQAQSYFGDPGSATGYFNLLNQVTADLNAAANDPASSLSGIQVVNDVNQFLNQSKSISTSLDGLSAQADTQIASDVSQVNQLLQEISGLNQNIAQATASGADPTDSQEAQNELINQLSGLIDIKTQPTSTGGQTLTSMSG